MAYFFRYKDLKKNNGQVVINQSVQVVDRQKRPLAVLSLAQVRRQRLFHQGVYLLSYATSQKISLTSFELKGKAYWDLSGFTLVQAGETAFSAAERIGLLYAGKDFSLTWQTSFFDEELYQFLDIYRFSFFPGEASLVEKKQLVALDRLEFERIFTDFPTMLGPHVSRLWHLNLLFKEEIN